MWTTAWTGALRGPGSGLAPSNPAGPAPRPTDDWGRGSARTIEPSPAARHGDSVAGPMMDDAFAPEFASQRPSQSSSRLDPDHERELVARAAAEPAAFGELYDFYLPRVYGFVLRRLGDPAVAEDVTAATFERALAALRGGTFRNDSFGGWLYRVAANAVVDHVRRQRRLVRIVTPPSTGDMPTGERDGGEIGDDRALAALAAALDRLELRRALLVLPEAQRRLLVLRFLDDLTTEELCAVLGCTRGALAVRLHRALRALRTALNGESTDAA
ncbi:MAG TPA: sigma-70 family RNA polymerase sigma factor [Candidatus Binatia bacterium]|nr:sigma-70 family RNA polymerase sigma factor [Candidatus Binatia bacterium]